MALTEFTNKEPSLRQWKLDEDYQHPPGPFKTVITEYFEEFDESGVRQVHVVSRTEEWVGSAHDPVATFTSGYL